MLEKLHKPFYQRFHKFTFYISEEKANNFDGIIGFGNNDKKKFSFTGSINLNLKNVFNSLRPFLLYWQRNQQSGQNFDLQTDIPYLLVLTSARISI